MRMQIRMETVFEFLGFFEERRNQPPLTGSAKALKFKYEDIEVGFDLTLGILTALPLETYTESITEGFTMSCMKTAISIEEGLFRKAEKLSSRLQVSRSQLFAQALEYLIERSETLEVIQRLNEVYGQKQPDKVVSKSSKRKMKRVIDKW